MDDSSGTMGLYFWNTPSRVIGKAFNRSDTACLVRVSLARVKHQFSYIQKYRNYELERPGGKPLRHP